MMGCYNPCSCQRQLPPRADTIPAALDAIRRKHQDATAAGFRAVLFGAGQCGRLTADWMDSCGLQPLALCDNNAAIWGQTHNGILITSPDFAADACSAATCVVCVRNPATAAEVRAQLDTMGVRHVDNCSWLAPPPTDVGDNLADAFADDASRRECLAQLNWRLGVANTLPHWPHDEMYFPRDLFRFHDHEVFVDLGAYDGDTFLEFHQRVNNFVGYVAFEPDLRNFSRLRAHMAKYTDCQHKLHIWNMAIGEDPGFLWFRASGDVSSRVCDHGESKVPCDRLDNLSWPEPPTFMKLDIEGSELSALKSGERLIRQHRPILAVCVYHKPQDLWEIPLWIAGLGVSYRVYLRRYGPADSELVVYGVPRERAMA